MKNLQYSVPIAIIIAGLVIAGAIYLIGNNGDTEQLGYQDQQNQDINKDNSNNESDVLAASEDDHIRGKKDAPVTIVEYSDFECPYCQSYHPTLKKALEEYPDKVRWVYRHFPLDRIHSQATPAAEASECAAEQGKFWEFADTLFSNQGQLGEDFYVQAAQDLNLNTDQFENCVTSRKYKEEVQQDFQSGQEVGVTGTPGSFVNGIEVRGGAVSYPQLQTKIEQALSELE